MSDKEEIGMRMKEYEMAEAGRKFLPLLPIVARLDGKGFSKFTKGLNRPYDERMSQLMIATATYLIQETNAVCGYTQSDEITLAWYSDRRDKQIYFDGRIQKMTSILAAMCSVHFNRLMPLYLPEKTIAEPVFDCRVWSLPTLAEAANVFLWRELDATKNSINMAAGEYYGPNELMHITGKEKLKLLLNKGVNWEQYPDFFKRGSYIQRRTFKKKLEQSELDSLPPKHHARQNPDLEFERTVYNRINMPPLLTIENRPGVIFNGEEPIILPKFTTIKSASEYFDFTEESTILAELAEKFKAEANEEEY